MSTEQRTEKSTEGTRKNKIVSDVRPILAAVSDIHLSSKPPIYRSLEPNWIEAQRRVLEQVIAVCNDNSVPLVIAGDLFHDWKDCTPELLNMVIEVFKKCHKHIYAIAGNHDLVHHSRDPQSKKRTAFWTLVRTGVIHELNTLNGITVEPAVRKPSDFDGKFRPNLIYGFEYGCGISPNPWKDTSNRPSIAVIHDYCYLEGAGDYPGVDPKKHITHWGEVLKKNGYRVGIFGDNHMPCGNFDKEILVTNCGNLIVRNRNEKPGFVSLLTSDFLPVDIEIDTSKDLYLDLPETPDNPTKEQDLKQLAHILGKLSDHHSNDFIPMLDQIRYSNAVSKRSARVIADIVRRLKGRE